MKTFFIILACLISGFIFAQIVPAEIGLAIVFLSFFFVLKMLNKKPKTGTN